MIDGVSSVKITGARLIRGICMHRIQHKRSSHLTLWLGLAAAVAVMAGFLHYTSVLAEKKKAGNYNYLKPVPSDSALHTQLKDEQYRVTRENATETAFRNEYWNNDRPGIYVDVITNDPLFSSLDKFDSGTGRPTFTKPISPDTVFEQPDNSHDMRRTEIRAKRSNAHLGYLFPDPKSPTGQSYSVNSAAFHFIPKEEMKNKGYEAFLPLLDKK